MENKSIAHTAIVNDVKEFIDRDVLGGQGEDLDENTPLYELGILDSFALIALGSFLTQKFGIELDLSQVDRAQTATISGIAALVGEKLGIASGTRRHE